MSRAAGSAPDCRSPAGRPDSARTIDPLLARLHQTKQRIAGNAAVTAHCAARDLPLDDEAAQIVFRSVGVERDFRAVQHPQQLGLAARQPQQELVEIVIAGADRKNAVESRFETGSEPRVRLLPIGLQRFIETPDQVPDGLDLFSVQASSASISAAIVRNEPNIAHECRRGTGRHRRKR